MWTCGASQARGSWLRSIVGMRVRDLELELDEIGSEHVYDYTTLEGRRNMNSFAEGRRGRNTLKVMG